MSIEKKPAQGMSQFAKSQSLRTFLLNSGLWGIWGQLAAVSGPVISGYCLWLGMKESDIALIMAIASLAGLVQPFAPMLYSSIKNQKRFLIITGSLQITMIVSIVLMPLFGGGQLARVLLFSGLILSGSFLGQFAAPLFNVWMSSSMGENTRARFLGRRFIVTNLTAMAAGYLAGQLLDFTGKGYMGFFLALMLALVTGAGGYIILLRIPFPESLKIGHKIKFSAVFKVPLGNPDFRSLEIFYLSWVFAAVVSDPFYSIFMIRDMGVSYSVIGILNMIVLGVGVIGYWAWGNIVGRFGGKPVMQMLFIPRVLIFIFWILLTPQNYGFLLPLIMVLNGIILSGLTVGINTMLFATIPENANSSSYFACWAFLFAVIASTGSAIGSLLAKLLESVSITAGGVVFGNIRLIFIVSALMHIVPVLLLSRVTDVKSKPVTRLVNEMFRGNPLTFVYNAFLFTRVKGTSQRARAIRRMGQSGNPLAVESLVKALDDVNPEVREQAVKGLGEVRSEEAVAHLARELEDDESDLQAEAALSLGKLKSFGGIAPLIKALVSTDTRVVISAVRALGDIGSNAAVDALHNYFSLTMNRTVLPSVIESLSRNGDRRMVPLALEALDLYRSPVIRLQLLNAVCRVMGGGNQYYQLISLEEIELAERLYQLIRNLERSFGRLGQKAAAGNLMATLKQQIREGQYDLVSETTAALLTLLKPYDLNDDLVDPESGHADSGGSTDNGPVHRESSQSEIITWFELFRSAEKEGRVERPAIFSLVYLGQVLKDSLTEQAQLVKALKQ